MNQLNKEELIRHYQTYFYTIKADTPKLREIAYQLRYRVFIEECSYKIGDVNDYEKTEMDHYDEHALHSLLFHKPTDKPIGYIRLIPFCKDFYPVLPIEECGKYKFDLNKISLDQLRTPKAGEISRMAILPSFRRRLYDTLIQGGASEENEVDHRRFKLNYLPMCLILASINLMYDEKIDYTLAMLEQRLILLLKRFGVHYDQIGDFVEYNGIRAPFMLFGEKTFSNLRPEFVELFKIIQMELNFSEHTDPLQLSNAL